MKNEENSFVASGQVFIGVESFIWAPCIPKTKSPLKTYSYFLNLGTKLKLSHIYSRGTKVEKMLTLAPERYTAGFCMVAKVILWCI